MLTDGEGTTRRRRAYIEAKCKECCSQNTVGIGTEHIGSLQVWSPVKKTRPFVVVECNVSVQEWPRQAPPKSTCIKERPLLVSGNRGDLQARARHSPSLLVEQKRSLS
mmetsp:Transcript_41477/g.110638  ORF Transcript_41477/g.110638 Transcript_41477/m.110638 type:complete len:108 (+) Transcript_41477:787-1110(+)